MWMWLAITLLEFWPLLNEYSAAHTLLPWLNSQISIFVPFRVADTEIKQREWIVFPSTEIVSRGSAELWLSAYPPPSQKSKDLQKLVKISPCCFYLPFSQAAAPLESSKRWKNTKMCTWPIRGVQHCPPKSSVLLLAPSRDCLRSLEPNLDPGTWNWKSLSYCKDSNSFGSSCSTDAVVNTYRCQKCHILIYCLFISPGMIMINGRNELHACGTKINDTQYMCPYCKSIA